MKRTLLLLQLLLQLAFTAHAGSQKVIVRISREAQKDTLGYNLMSHMPKIVYDAIQNNTVKLWDSPLKKLQITPQTLKDIERSNKFSFTDLDNIFIYETWTIKKKNIQAVTEGILFATRNKKDQEISFGFVEYKELQELFRSALLPANANGFLNIDIDQVIRLKRYNYSIIQYGKKLITNEVLSEKLKNDIFNKRVLLYDGEIIQQNKRIIYSIPRLTGNEIKEQTGNMLLDSVQAYLQKNIEEYMNLGGGSFESYLDKVNVKIEKIEVVEIWTKSQNMQSYRPEQLIISSNGHSLDPVSIENFLSWMLRVNNKTVDELLRLKQFTFRIKKINDQEIPESDSGRYLEALTNASWSQLSEYVKR